MTCTETPLHTYQIFIIEKLRLIRSSTNFSVSSSDLLLVSDIVLFLFSFSINVTYPVFEQRC